jgi:ComEC/Rec2-related protein
VPAVAFFYAGVAGNDPPVLRAAFMAGAIAIAAFVRRWDRPLRVLCWSGTVLALAWPGVFFQVGFQMSYAATAALLWGWSPRAGVDDLSSRGNGLWARAGRLWRASLAAQAALAPFLLYYFGRFAWVGIFSNLVAVPLAELALALGAGLGFLHTVWPSAAGVMVPPTEGVLSALAAWARVCARLPAAEVTRPLSLAGAIVVGGGVIVAFGAVRSFRYKKAGLSVAALLVLGGLWAGAIPSTECRVRWHGGRVRKIVMARGDEVYALRVSTTGVGPLWENGGNGRGAPGVLRRPTGPGYAFDIDTPGGRLFVAVGLSRAQQKALLREGLGRVEVLGWTPAGRGPPSEEFLRALSPRWVVYQGPRLPKVVRALDPPAGVHRAGAAGVVAELVNGVWRLEPG